MLTSAPLCISLTLFGGLQPGGFVVREGFPFSLYHKQGFKSKSKPMGSKPPTRGCLTVNLLAPALSNDFWLFCQTSEGPPPKGSFFLPLCNSLSPKPTLHLLGSIEVPSCPLTWSYSQGVRFKGRMFSRTFLRCEVPLLVDRRLLRCMLLGC